MDVGGSSVVFNAPASDDDGRPRSTDGLQVARRVVATLSTARRLELPAYSFVDAVALLARAGETLPRIRDPQRRRLAEL